MVTMDYLNTHLSHELLLTLINCIHCKTGLIFTLRVPLVAIKCYYVLNLPWASANIKREYCLFSEVTADKIEVGMTFCLK